MAARKKKEEEKAAKEARRPKAGDVPPTRDERAASLLEYVKTKMKGRAQLKMASEYELPYLTKRLPTGLLSLDIELRGGFPSGGLSQIIGPKNSGKSWVCWQVVRQLQEILGDKMKVLIAMTEMRADRSQAKSAGVHISMGDEDIENMSKARQKNGWPPFTKEEIAALKYEVGEIHELHGFSAEDLYDAIIMAVESNVYHAIIIDSFGSIMSGAEAEAESLNEHQYSGASAVNTKFLRKLSALLTMDDDYGKTRDVCVLGINHIRDAIGQQHVEYKAPGGKALEHAKFVDLYVASGKPVGYEGPVFTPEGRKQQFVKTGKEVNWRIEKGKAGMHEGGRGTFIYDYRINTADFFSDALVAGVKTGVVLAEGAWYTIPMPDDPNRAFLRIQGRENFVKALIEDVQLKSASGEKETYLNLIRDLAFKREGINIHYEWD